MRLFVALEVPAAVRNNLAAFMEDMHDLSVALAEKQVRWVRPENLHVTLKFVGEVPEAKLDGIRAALSTVHAATPLDIQFRGLGFFPNESRPTVLWTGLNAATNLQSLAEDIDRELSAHGIPEEKRPFVPHLTLARFAAPGINKQLLSAIQRNRERDFGSFQAHSFHLLESKLRSSGAEYTSLQSYRFGAES